MGIAGGDVGRAPGISIRPATANDAEAVGYLMADAAGPLAAPIWGSGSIERTRERFAGMFGCWGGSDHHFVACEDERTVGVIAHTADRMDPWQSLRASLATFRVYGVLGSFALSWRMRHMVSAEPALVRNSYRVWNLAVAEDQRRRGIGSLLLRHAHRGAREAGALTIGLEVLIGNAGAIAFYKNAGYRERRRRESAGLRKMTGAAGLIYMDRAVRDDD
ncbi:MAG: GNAT family N-acetyltransferase [Chloroflexota bacterium]|nr:GNAT family N-acetyltransferase [Chloroflexota bacterium]MDE2898948.1 GNAT family N-acetyltransferase [Chloroflexota bacterium]